MDRDKILEALGVENLSDNVLANWWMEYIDPDDNSTPDMIPDVELEGYLNAAHGGFDPDVGIPAWQEGFKLACAAWCRLNQ